MFSIYPFVIYLGSQTGTSSILSDHPFIFPCSHFHAPFGGHSRQQLHLVALLISISQSYDKIFAKLFRPDRYADAHAPV